MPSTDAPSQPDTPPDVMDQAKQLLALGNLVNQYPDIVARRTVGLLYVLIGGAVSIAGLTFVTLVTFAIDIANNLFVVMAFVAVVLGITWLISFKLIVPLTRSYPKPTRQPSPTDRKVFFAWLTIAFFIMILTFYSFGTGQPHLFPLGIQLFIGGGNLFNYSASRNDPTEAPFARSNLAFSLGILASMVPIFLFPTLSYTIMMIVDLGGIYGLGLYMLSSAERLLLTSLER